MRTRPRAAADGDDPLHEIGIHDAPVVGLLRAHAEADDGFEGGGYLEVLGQQEVLRADAVRVAEFAREGEEGFVAGGGGFGVAEHGDDYDVVVRQGVVGGGGEGEGGVDVAAVAGGD